MSNLVPYYFIFKIWDNCKYIFKFLTIIVLLAKILLIQLALTQISNLLFLTSKYLNDCKFIFQYSIILKLQKPLTKMPLI